MGWNSRRPGNLAIDAISVNLAVVARLVRAANRAPRPPQTVYVVWCPPCNKTIPQKSIFKAKSNAHEDTFDLPCLESPGFPA